MTRWEDLHTEERQRLIETDWLAGMTARQIAGKYFGATRNAIIGYVHRMGLRRDPTLSRANFQAAMGARARSKPKPKAKRPRIVAPKVRLVALPEPSPMLDATHAKPWMERKFGECAFPISGEGADTLSCCAPCGDATYCRGHAEIMFRPFDNNPKAYLKSVTRWAA